MAEWIRVTECPRCGGKLTISSFYTYSKDYHIKRDGTLSQRFKISESGPIDCMTAYCESCEAYWDGAHVCVESDDTVYLKEG